MALDLMNLLCLDARHSRSPFGGQHRQILVSKAYNNSGDFVFNNLLQHFGRREPNSSILLITLSHDWSNYSIASSKCGFNLRRKENGGNISIIDVMKKFLLDTKQGLEENYCSYILEQFNQFLCNLSSGDQAHTKRPITVMLDDLSVLESLGHDHHSIYQMTSNLSNKLRNESTRLAQNHLNHLIIQSSGCLDKMLSNLQNTSDICLIMRPLDTGHSTRVDGTLTIIDNRLPSRVNQQPTSILLAKSNEIGSKNTYFFKLGDRRVRLTTSALII